MADGEVDNNPAVDVRQLTAVDLLLRVLAKPKWLVDLHEAFILRSNETTTGLSVCFDCTPAEAVTISGLNRSHGVATLTVGSVTALELTVVPDELHHANIQGLPDKELDPDRAEWFASRLAQAAQIVDRTRREQ